MSNIKFSAEHEWIQDNGDGTVLIGITDFAQQQLGDLVFVEMPELGSEIVKGEEISVIESVKAASDLFAPVDGTVVEVNEALEDEPELINEDAMANWILKVELSDPSDLDDLMDEDAYNELTED
ncbi:glycine cleavage system protein GcvH [Thiomicrorhabdus lithotrophica]|uniref:Glycine cleavage system H protein n=1 Tax=Thiomicrorhabdus lithotrophica TaxID=2949997 RepID=A0ABY8CBP9_9GAMM|nr:glycine cleavage system protein GcvH [Thiomicrorhabdus lithotrophica]WEJ63415.1 glycine cleavage system protein GcvH [Thiomicrorhabdus lithotrophica]